MKNNKWISCLSALALLLSVFGGASAMSIQIDKNTLLPTITSISGDQEFSHETVSILDLPGTMTLLDEMPVPVGFAKGEKQFEGLGLKVTGFDYGKARICFPISNIDKGWGGKVAKWTGSRWDLLATTISTPADSGYSLACSNINSSGIFALITWIVDASKLPIVAQKLACNFSVSWVELTAATPPVDYGTYFTTNITQLKIYSTTDLNGKNLTISVNQSTPSGAYTWNTSAAGTLASIGPNEYSLGPFTAVLATLQTTLTSEEYLLDFGNCTVTAPNGNYME